MGLFGPSYHGLCKEGIKAFESGNVEKASDLFMRAMKMDPSQPRAFGWLGMTYQAAMDEFFMAGDKIQQKEHGELAVKAFDEAIRREDDVQLKAELWRQRGRVLAGLGRLEERDASWSEADKLIPGMVAERNQSALENAFKEIAKRKP